MLVNYRTHHRMREGTSAASTLLTSLKVAKRWVALITTAVGARDILSVSRISLP